MCGVYQNPVVNKRGRRVKFCGKVNNYRGQIGGPIGNLAPILHFYVYFPSISREAEKLKADKTRISIGGFLFKRRQSIHLQYKIHYRAIYALELVT